jgi:putative glutamine amidotransferase
VAADSRPLIAITPWRRTLETWVHPRSDLYTLDPEYVDAVEQAGGDAVILPHVHDPHTARRLLARFDGLIVSGGDDVDPSFYGATNEHAENPDPIADRSDIELTLAAHELGMPLLAVCRGPQVLNVAFGGTLHQHVWGRGDHPPKPDTGDALADADRFLAYRHRVRLEPGSIIAKIFDREEIVTNSMHHQSVDQLGDGIVVTGRAGDGVVEVIEHESGRFLGVQWHPERLADEGHRPLFDWLIAAARAEA